MRPPRKRWPAASRRVYAVACSDRRFRPSIACECSDLFFSRTDAKANCRYRDDGECYCERDGHMVVVAEVDP